MAARLTGDDWIQRLHTFTTTAFRWETQGVYHEPYEQEALRQFLAGEPVDTGFVDGWLAEVRRVTAAGRQYRRVRVITEPVSDYLRFELHLTPLNVAAGEDVRLLPAARQQELGLPSTDFWLLDDVWAGRMHFGGQGFEYAEEITDPDTLSEFREIRDLAWKDAIPFGDFQLK